MCFSFCGSQSKRYNRAKAPRPIVSASTSVQHSRRSNSSFANHKKTPKKPPATQVSNVLATSAIWSNFLATFNVRGNLIKFLAT